MGISPCMSTMAVHPWCHNTPQPSQTCLLLLVRGWGCSLQSLAQVQPRCAGAWLPPPTEWLGQASSSQRML